jgi:Spy/CpxP family protein refolding chaperone
MVIGPKLKIYGVVAGIFVLGASAGGAAGYAMASKRLNQILREDRPTMGDARRMEAMSDQLDLTRAQRRQVREILERHRDENRELTRAMAEKCGADLQSLRARVDAEIRGVLDPQQAQRFDQLVEKRGRLFPLGAPPGPRRRKGE